MNSLLHSTWTALTWRKMLLMQALGQLAIFAQSLEGKLFGAWLGHQSLGYASMALNVCLILPAALFADTAVDQGSSARRAYPLAILSTVPLGAAALLFMQWIYVLVFGLPPGRPNLFSRALIETAFETYIYGAFVMLVFFNQRTADRIVANFRKAELRRAQLENQLIDSRLATAQAQIDPTMLFTALGDIRLGYQRSAPDAEDRLNGLIQSLRSALARTVAVNAEDGVRP